MNRLNELADRLEQAMGGVTVKEIAALLRAASAEQVGTEWISSGKAPINTGSDALDCFSVAAVSDSVRAEACERHNADLQAARLAVAAARKERDEAREGWWTLYAAACPDWASEGTLEHMASNIVRRREHSEQKRAALQRAIDEAKADASWWKDTVREVCNHVLGNDHWNPDDRAIGTPIVCCVADAMKNKSDLQAVVNRAHYLATHPLRCGELFDEIAELLESHATQREGTKADIVAEVYEWNKNMRPRQWSSTPPQDCSGRWWHAFGGKGCSGVFVVPEELTWDASAVRSKDYNLWLPYLDGDTRDTLPPLPNSSATVTGSPAHADDTRELVARLAEWCRKGSVAEPEAIIAAARRGGGA